MAALSRFRNSFCKSADGRPGQVQKFIWKICRWLPWQAGCRKRGQKAFVSRKYCPFGFLLRARWFHFWSILEVLGAQRARILFVLGVLWHPWPPWARSLRDGLHRPHLFSDVGSQREPKGVPKWIQHGKENSPKTMQNSMRYLMDL